MRMHILAGVLLLAVGSTRAHAACPPELLQKMVDQGYSREEVLQLCGGERGSDGMAAVGPSEGASSALARLRELTADLDRRCRATPSSNVQGTGPSDLSRQYRGLLAQWERGQEKCSAGDTNACQVLEEAADQFFAGIR